MEMLKHPDDNEHLSSYELVARSLEDNIKYDNLSDPEKSRAHKNRVRQVDRRSWKHKIIAKVRTVDMFWILTILSVGIFVLIALSLLYFRHSHLEVMHRFTFEALSRRRQHLGYDHIYVIERPVHEDATEHRERWKAAARRLEIDVEMWPVTAPKPLDPQEVKLYQRECWRPHLSLFRDVIAKGYKDALVIEDHVVFGPSPRLRIYGALMEIPADWDVLQLGPAANGTDSGHHDAIPINGAPLAYRRVDDGACNNLAYGISHTGATKIVKMIDTTEAHADFEHKMLDALDRIKLLLFRVSPSLFAWREAETAI
ncbi:hypothetical protein H4S08_001138 [Coemansia sp. RSA 1365]|nr:hypothetical protein H4S08_001138 [Coemansia sp. RSA 1365]